MAKTTASKAARIDDRSEKELLRDILETLQDSSTAGPTAAKDTRSRFWEKYKRVAEEHDSEFLERYSSDMDIVLIFSGLFSAVSTSFIVAMEPSLLPDPSDTTNSLLLHIAQTLGNSTTPGYIPTAPTIPIFQGPPRTDVWVQTIAYLSLASSLLAAFGAVLGKQWLGYYKSSRYGRGSLEERGIRRQEKSDGLQTWYLDAVLQSFPLLIQFSLFLFGIALSGHLWSEQRPIAGVVIAATTSGILFYFFTVFVSLLSPACPFQSPLSRILPYIIRIVKRLPACLHAYTLHQTQQPSQRNPTVASQRIVSRHHPKSDDIEGGYNAEGFIRSSTPEDAAIRLPRSLLDKPQTVLEAPSILWLIETSTDPEVLLAASRIVPMVEWRPDLRISTGFIQLSQMFLHCFYQDRSLIPDERDKAFTYGLALVYLFWEMDEKTLQATMILPGSSWHAIADCLSGLEMGAFFKIMAKGRKGRHSLLETSLDTKEFYKNPLDECATVDEFLSQASKELLLQVLHLLPYASFEFASVEEYLYSSFRYLILGVISRFLNGQTNLAPDSPGVSDCVMVLGMLFGLKIHPHDKRRIEKRYSDIQSQSLLAELIRLYGTYSMAFEGMFLFVRDKVKPLLDRFQPESPPCEQAMNLDECKAIDCIPLMASLCSMDPSSSVNVYLSIGKACFDKSFTQVGHDFKPSKRGSMLPFLKASIRSVATLMRGSQNTEDSFIPNLGPKHYQSPKPVTCSWLLHYSEYLCATYPLDTDAMLDFFVVSEYALTNLRESPAWIRCYLDALVVCMGQGQPHSLRRTALRAAYLKRRDIFQVGFLEDFSNVLNSAFQDLGDVDESLHHYVGLISTVAKMPEWHPHLWDYSHIRACFDGVRTLRKIYPTLLFAVLRTTIAARLAKSFDQRIVTEVWDHPPGSCDGFLDGPGIRRSFARDRQNRRVDGLQGISL